jgi:hypothetical protein
MSGFFLSQSSEDEGFGEGIASDECDARRMNGPSDD